MPVPLYHCFGMVLGNLGCTTRGATIVYPSEAFDPGAVLEAVEAERCTALYGVPTMFIAELDHPDFARRDLSSLRTGVMAGSPCPIEVMKRVADRDAHARGDDLLRHDRDLAGVVPVAPRRSARAPRRRRSAGCTRTSSARSSIRHGGAVVPRGTPGELCTRGYCVMLGYWENEAATREAIDAAGWMHTGDLAVMDDAGYVNIVGRSKDMVIRGGENIYPREVEEFLYTHPAIADVQVIGVPDARYGEELCAWVRLRPGADADASTRCAPSAATASRTTRSRAT